MNKKGIMLLAVLLTAGSMVFASGQKDKDDDFDRDDYGWGYGPRWGMMDPRDYDDCPCYDEDAETVNLTGTIDFTAAGTTLNAGGKTWLLMYPMWALQDVEISRGDKVAVEGYVVTDPVNDFRETKEGNYLHVTKAEINGKTYELDQSGYGGMMGGGRMGDNRRGGGRPGFRR